jgi:hypothetical protein
MNYKNSRRQSEKPTKKKKRKEKAGKKKEKKENLRKHKNAKWVGPRCATRVPVPQWMVYRIL